MNSRIDITRINQDGKWARVYGTENGILYIDFGLNRDDHSGERLSHWIDGAPKTEKEIIYFLENIFF